jgi:MFS family permease
MPEEEQLQQNRRFGRKKALALAILAVLILLASLVLLLAWIPSPAEGQTLRFSKAQQWCVGGSFASGMILLTFAVFRFVVGSTGGFIGFTLKIIGAGVIAAGIGIGAVGGLFLWAALSTDYEYHQSGSGDFDWD